MDREGAGLVPVGDGVQQRPRPGGHGDLGEVLGTRTEFMHVPLRGERIHRDRMERAEWQLVLGLWNMRLGLSAQLAQRGGSLVGAVHDQHDFRRSGQDGLCGPVQLQLEGGSSFGRAVDPGRPDTEILGGGACRESGNAGGSNTVDVAETQPGLAERSPTGLRDELQDGLVRDAEIRLGHADDHGNVDHP